MEVALITLAVIAGGFVMLVILGAVHIASPIYSTWVDLQVQSMKAKHRQAMKYMDSDLS